MYMCFASLVHLPLGVASLMHMGGMLFGYERP